MDYVIEKKTDSQFVKKEYTTDSEGTKYLRSTRTVTKEHLESQKKNLQAQVDEIDEQLKSIKEVK